MCLRKMREFEAALRITSVEAEITMSCGKESYTSGKAAMTVTPCTMKYSKPTKMEEIVLSADEVAEQVVLEYFSQIGCDIHKGASNRYHSLLRLPLATTEWTLRVKDELITIDLYKSWFDKKKQQPMYVNLSDPDGLPQLLAHMQKHSKFLRGGIGKTIIPIKAT